MGIIKAVCISKEKEMCKKNEGAGLLVEEHGLQNDSHAGS